MSNASVILTWAEKLTELGDIPPARVRQHPAPGTATEADVLEVQATEGKLCELVDRTLVEKAIGYAESVLALVFAHLIRNYLVTNPLGIVAGADGTIRILGDTVRIPDVSFVSWERLPGRQLPTEPIPALVPDLVIEVLSPTNTKQEMSRKRREYFHAGVRLVWMVDPRDTSIAVYTSPTDFQVLRDGDQITGGIVLPGFTADITAIFDELQRQGPQAGEA